MGVMPRLARLDSVCALILGGVDVNARVQPPRVSHCRAQKVVITGVGCMGRHPGGDTPARAALPTFDKGRRGIQRGVALAGKDGPTQHAARTRLLDRPRRLVHEEIVVGDRRDAGLDHLDQAKQHAPVDVFGCQVAFDWPDELVEPAVDRHVLGQAAKEHHRHMSVRVDQPRHGQLGMRLDHLMRLDRVPWLAGLDRRDALVFDKDVLVVGNRIVSRVPAGQDMAVVDGEIVH